MLLCLSGAAAAAGGNTATQTLTLSDTLSETVSASHSASLTESASLSLSQSQSLSFTSSSTVSASSTASESVTMTLPTGTATLTFTLPTLTASITESPTFTMTLPTATASVSLTHTFTLSPTVTYSHTETHTLTLPTGTLTLTPTESFSLTLTLPTATATFTESLSLTYTFTLPTATESFSLTHTESQSLTWSRSFEGVFSKVVVEVFRPGFVEYPNVVTVSSQTGFNQIGSATVSKVLFLMKGGRLFKFADEGPADSPTQWDRNNCTRVYVGHEIELVRCNLFWFPSVYTFNQEYTTATSIMVGHVYVGAVGLELSCGELVCRNTPSIEEVTGCFRTGSGTFGCNPFLSNDILFNVTARHIHPSMSPVVYIGDDPPVICEYLPQHSVEWSDNNPWRFSNYTGPTEYPQKFVRCRAAIDALGRTEAAMRLHVQGKLHPLRAFGPNSTEMMPEIITPHVAFAPAVLSLDWNLSSYRYNLQQKYSKDVTAGEGLLRGSGWCTGAGDTLLPAYDLVCYRPHSLLLIIRGWNLMRFCTAQACNPTVVAVGEARYLPVFDPVQYVTDQEIGVFLTSDANYGTSGPFVITVQSPNGEQAMSNVTLTLHHPATVTRFLCLNNYTQEAYNDHNRGEVECAVPGGFTFYGDGFDPHLTYRVVFIPTGATPDYSTDAELGPQQNVTCDVVEVQATKLRCVIDNAYKKNDWRLGKPFELEAIVGGIGRGNYTAHIVGPDEVPAVFDTGASGDSLTLWSPPKFLRISGCRKDAVDGSISQHCDGTTDVVLHGLRLPPNALLFYQVAEIVDRRMRALPWTPCEPTSWIPPLYRTLACRVPYARRLLPQLWMLRVQIGDLYFTNPDVAAHFDASPDVVSIESAACVPSGNGTLLCPSHAEVRQTDRHLVLRGSGFYGYGSMKIGFGLHACSSVAVVNDSVAVCRKWAVLTHEPVNLPVAVARGQEPLYYSSVLVNFNPVPYVSNVTGCHGVDGNGTFDCVAGTDGGAITILGANFKWQDAKVTVHLGDTPCTLVEVVSDSIVLCTHYPHARGSLQVVSVQVGVERTPSAPTQDHRLLTVSFSCPRVNGLICSGNGVCDETTGECVCNTHWDAREACRQCEKNFFGPECDETCTCNTRTGGVCFDGFNGTGTCSYCFENYWGPNCLLCPTPFGQVCGGHGLCDQGVNGTGHCTCDHMGWDESRSCENCFPTRFGATCTSVCPGGGVCSGNGVCDHGFNGTGTCACFSEYSGSDCALQCEKTPAGAWCSGHGECVSSACQCHSNLENGFWDGAVCDVCRDGWSGIGCDIRCPTTGGLTCSGQGTCSSGECQCGTGFCGVDCSIPTATCEARLCAQTNAWGASCEFVCPGTGAGVVCSGHGSCDAGRAGSGVCTCVDPYKGAACDRDCSLCLGGGTCGQDGTCICAYPHAGTYCDRSCPAPGGRVCSNRGTCDWGNTASGLCQCHFGYAGAGCETECTGGPFEPCGGNGLCRPSDGGCDCFNLPDTARGAWTGVMCDRCAPPFVAPFCNSTCPGLLPDGKTVCTGNGLCDQSTLGCHCHRHDATGHYVGAACEQCVAGYWGPTCQLQCPGGACKACSEHGTCGDGMAGDGVCTCHANRTHGMWWGDRCDLCVEGWYGAGCTGKCPGEAVPGVVCNGRGVCADGRTGSGVCTCFGAVGEFWGRGDCGDCQPDYFGPSCSSLCPAGANGLTCSGNGRCDDGVRGSGVCMCQESFTGAECSLPCPHSEAGVCGGRGLCVEATPGVVACVCSVNGTGHFAKSSASPCSSCQPGWWGTSCDRECPGGAATPCSGRASGGTCGAAGACACVSGWAGEACAQECPGGEASPCFAHGSCGTANGTAVCRCASSGTLGHWTGAACDECRGGYVGVTCSVPCPPGVDGQPCSGGARGRCFDWGGAGRCLCADGYCGAACELAGAVACEDLSCPPGYAGLACAQRCPACGPRGVCDGGTQGTGTCVCDEGFGGATCEAALDCTPCRQGRCGGAVTPLNADGGLACACYAGWAGRWCSVECRGGFREPCHGHGACDDGTDGTGACVCVPGWRGASCNATCPGRTASGEPCSGNGVCQQYGAPCRCDVRWSGTLCDECAFGWSGDLCDVPCSTGITNKKLCECAWGWYGSDCAGECPGRLGNATSLATTSQVCSQRGECRDGNAGDGTCRCEPNYYGAACEVRCIEAVTCAAFAQRSVVCSDRGCVCATDNVRGHWAGPTCTECADGYWGGACQTPCACHGHAYRCAQHTGACECADDDVLGHWAPPTCVGCAPGFTDVRCTSRQIAVTRVGGATALFQSGYNNISNSFVIIDNVEKRVIVTSIPPAVYTYDSLRRVAYSEQLSREFAGWSGQILGYGFSSTGEYFWFLNTHRTGRVEAVLVVRKALVPLNTFPLNPNGKVGAFVDQPGRRDADVQQATTLPSLPTEAAAAATVADTVFIQPSLYAFYRFADGRNELHRTRMDEGAMQVQLESKTDLGAHVDEVLAAEEWRKPTLSSGGQAKHHIALLGVKSGENVLLVLTSTPALRTVTFQRVNVSLGNAVDADLRLIKFYKQQYLFTTLKRRATGALQERLVLVRVSLDEALAQPANANNVQSEDAFESATPFDVKSMAVTNAPDQGQVTLTPRLPDGRPGPSTLVTFDPLSFSVTGTMDFTYFAGEPEAVVDIVNIPELRMSLALPGTSYLRFAQMNSFAVTAAIPKVIDVSGSTSVTLVGKGFVAASADSYCSFLGQVLPARNVTTSTLVCDLPPLDGYRSAEGEGCAGGEPIEASVLGSNRFSSNNVRVSLAASATVSSLSPTFVHQSAAAAAAAEAAAAQQRQQQEEAGSDNVVEPARPPLYLELRGYGFLPSSGSQCVLNRTAAAGSPALAYFGDAVYRASNMVICAVANAEALEVSRQPYMVSVSHDGQFFPEGVARFQVVGDPAGAAVEMKAASVTVSAGPTYLPPITITTTDAVGNALRPYSIDAERRTASVRDWLQCSNATHSVAVPLMLDAVARRAHGELTSLELVGGEAVIRGLYVEAPPAGKCRLRVAVNPGSASEWVAESDIAVATGHLAQLTVLKTFTADNDPRVPNGTFAYDYPEPIGPIVVQGADGGGNVVHLESTDILTAVVQREDTGETLGRTIVYPNEIGTEWSFFVAPPQDLRFGSEYHIVLRLLDVRAPAPSLRLGPVVKKPCGTFGSPSQAQHYAVLRSATCKECPSGGVCDGTSTILAKPGFWRDPVEYKEGSDWGNEEVYGNLVECPNRDACEGGANATCARGYVGITCGACVDGYGRSGSSCVQCLPQGENVVIVLAVALFLIAVVAWFVHRTLFEAAHGNKSLMFVFLKLLLSYIQMLAACLGDDATKWPTALQTIFAPHRKVLTFHRTFSPFSCLTTLSAYNLYLFIVLVPVLWAFMLGLAYPLVHVCIQWFESRRGKRAQREIDEDVRKKGSVVDPKFIYANDKVFTAKTERRSVRDVHRASVLPSLDADAAAAAADAGPEAPDGEELGQFVAFGTSICEDPPSAPAHLEAGPSGPEPEVEPPTTDGPAPQPPQPSTPPGADTVRTSISVSEPPSDPPISVSEPADIRRESDGSKSASGSDIGRGMSLSIPIPSAGAAGLLSPPLSSAASNPSRSPRPKVKSKPGSSLSVSFNETVVVSDDAAPTPQSSKQVSPGGALKPRSALLSKGADRSPKSASLGVPEQGMRVRRALSTTGVEMLMFDVGDDDADSDDEADNDAASAAAAADLTSQPQPSAEPANTMQWIASHATGDEAEKKGEKSDNEEAAAAGASTGDGAGAADGAGEDAEKEKGTPAAGPLDGKLGGKGFKNLWQAKIKIEKGSVSARTQKAMKTPKKVILKAPVTLEPFPNTLVGKASLAVCVGVKRPPAVSLRLTPRNPLLSFVPKSILFTEHKTTANMSVLGKMQGEYVVNWVVSGANKDDYATPSPTSVIFFKAFELTAMDIVCTAWIVGYFIVHPLQVLFAASLVECGEVNGRSYLEMDVEEECYTSRWYRWQGVNATGFFLYTVLLPACLFVTLSRRRQTGEDSPISAFSFILTGYTKRCWYWDFVIMVRKVLLIAASVFIERLLYRLFVTQWIVLLSLAMNLAVHPFEYKVHHNAENTVLVTLLITLNLGLYYFRSDLISSLGETDYLDSDPMLYLVYIALVACNLCVFGAFLILFLQLYRMRLIEEGKHGMVEWISRRDDGFFQNLTLWELAVTMLKRNVACLRAWDDEEDECEPLTDIEMLEKRREQRMSAAKRQEALRMQCMLGVSQEDVEAMTRWQETGTLAKPDEGIKVQLRTQSSRRQTMHTRYGRSSLRSVGGGPEDDEFPEADAPVGEVLYGPVSYQKDVVASATQRSMLSQEKTEEQKRPQPRRGSVSEWAEREAAVGAGYEETISAGLTEIQRNLYREQWQVERDMGQNPLAFDRAVELGIAEQPYGDDEAGGERRGSAMGPGRGRDPMRPGGLHAELKPTSRRGGVGVGKSISAQ